jgi:hypothetical protein
MEEQPQGAKKRKRTTIQESFQANCCLFLEQGWKEISEVSLKTDIIPTKVHSSIIY